MTSVPEETNWLSNSEQIAWFNEFKITDGQVTGIPLDGFKKFIDITVRSYCDNLIKQDDIICADEYKQKILLNDEEISQLFSSFDINNDGYIDMNGFKNLAEKWLNKFYKRSCALIIVDVQNDFIDGSLALINGPAEQDGVEVVDVINHLLDTWKFDAIVYTQDWHPRDHLGFFENLHLRKYRLKGELNNNDHNDCIDDSNTVEDADEQAYILRDMTIESDHDTPTTEKSQFKYEKLIHKAKLFDVVLFDDGKVEQKIWPIHCVQNSWGAELHPKLRVIPDAIRILKGTLSNVDAYSAFWDNMHLNETGLRQELTMRNIDDVFVCGLALDYCVAFTALDSRSAGFRTYVIEDACRGINYEDMSKKCSEMIDRGIVFIDSLSIGYNATKAMQAIVWTRDFMSKRCITK